MLIPFYDFYVSFFSSLYFSVFSEFCKKNYGIMGDLMSEDVGSDFLVS